MSQGCCYIKITNIILAFILFACPATFAQTMQLPQNVIDRVQAENGDNAIQRLKTWQSLINDYQQAAELDKLRLVNQFFNKNVHYVPDQDVWAKRDYWATPLEFIVKNAGDCEDFAIAKYYTLKKLGVPINKMRLTYARSTKLGQAHMVLTYYENPQDEPLILDNLTTDILFASERPDLLPVYSFNGDGLWMTGSIAQKDTGTRIGKSGNRMRLWLNLNERMQKDGLK